MFAAGLLKATEHELTSLFMTRMQCIGLAKDGWVQKWSQHRVMKATKRRPITPKDRYVLLCQSTPGRPK